MKLFFSRWWRSCRRWRQRGDIIMVALKVIFSSSSMLLCCLIRHACIFQPALFAAYHYNNNSITAAIIFHIKNQSFFFLHFILSCCVWVWMTGSTRFSSWKSILHHTTTPCRYTHQDHNPKHRKEKRQAFNLSFALTLIFSNKMSLLVLSVLLLYTNLCIYSEYSDWRYGGSDDDPLHLPSSSLDLLSKLKGRNYSQDSREFLNLSYITW